MQQHIPVLLQEVLTYLNPQPAEHYLDLTAGYGGHAREVLNLVGKNGRAVLVDRDQNAINHISKDFEGDKRIKIIHADYLKASQQLCEEEQKFDLILADIGLSSPHLDNASRGFSFQNDGPLDMRMDNRQELTAERIVNDWNYQDLVSILRSYGEVRGASRITNAIIDARPIKTTSGLASIINNSTKGYPKVRLESQVFQAIRIAVNGELEQLKSSLPLWHQLLKPKGRLAVISFHSLEDRLVKRYFQEYGGDRFDTDLSILTKQPVISTPQESFSNPRARSAKLRVVQRK